MSVRITPGTVLLIVAAIALPAMPYMFTVSNYVLNIFMQALTYAIAVLGMTVVLGYTGQINLAQAAFFGFGAYGAALGTVTLGLNFWFALLLGVGAAGLAGGILGLTTLRLGGHYLAMITISFQQIFDLVAVNWVELTHGPDGIAGIQRPSVFGYPLSQDRDYLVMCAVALYALILLVWWLPGLRLGRAMRAVRENELAAEVVGVHTLRVKVIAFTLSAVLGGIGGALYAGGFAYVSPDNFNFARSIEFLTMVLLGGAQSPFGAALGTTLLILLPEWLRFLKEIYLAAYGIAVILIMVFMPEGIWGILRNTWHKLRPPVTPIKTGFPALQLDIAAKGNATILKLVGLEKHFGGLRAVDGIDLEVKRGTR
jgi:branched-chain amino acid transport system permease protein